MAEETTYIFDVTLTLELTGVEITTSGDLEAAEKAAMDECQSHGTVADYAVTWVGIIIKRERRKKSNDDNDKSNGYTEARLADDGSPGL